jgi:hypothetical protein
MPNIIVLYSITNCQNFQRVIQTAESLKHPNTAKKLKFWKDIFWVATSFRFIRHFRFGGDWIRFKWMDDLVIANKGKTIHLNPIKSFWKWYAGRSDETSTQFYDPTLCNKSEDIKKLNSEGVMAFWAKKVIQIRKTGIKLFLSHLQLYYYHPSASSRRSVFTVRYELIIYNSGIPAMAQAVSIRSNTAEARIRYQASIWNLWWSKSERDRFIAEYFGFSRHYHSTIAP